MQEQIIEYPGIRLVDTFPEFPKNKHGLQRGSYIFSNSEEIAEQYEYPRREPIPLCYDGTHVRCNNISWTIDELVSQIDSGTWHLAGTSIDTELITAMERQMGGQVTLDIFWGQLWDTQNPLPKKFRLRTASNITSQALKDAAAIAGKNLFIHFEAGPHKVDKTKSGQTSISIPLSNSDRGHLEGTLRLSLSEMLSGDKIFLCELK